MDTSDLIGKVVGYVTIMSVTTPKITKWQLVHRYNCLCKCGNEVVRERGGLLNTKSIVSCGCFQQEVRKRTFKHKMSKTKLYKVWQFMKERCTKPQVKQYHNYGGRGIKVCNRWLMSFSDFYEDMGLMYKEGLQLDRIDNNGNYEKDNCRWVTHKMQQRNRTDNRRLTIFGRTLCVVEFEEILGYKSGDSVIRSRLKHYKWSDEDYVLGKKIEQREINTLKIKAFYESN